MPSNLRLAFRSLGGSPGFTIAAIGALALGIGANTAMFSLVDAVLVRPLPFAEPDRLVMVWEAAPQVSIPQNTPAPGNYASWKAENSSFVDIAATRGMAAAITGDGAPEVIPARRVTASFFSVLGVAPQIGRTFTDQEDSTGARVVVIAHSLWQRRFAGDASAIGRQLRINEVDHTIIGVMPSEFYFLPSPEFELWTPINFSPKDLVNRDAHYLHCVARLKPGVSAEQAQSEVESILHNAARQHPSAEGVGAVVVPLRRQLAGNNRTALLLLLAGAGCVLLIACANVANLLMARGAKRRRELAVRVALGASSSRLVLQLGVESLLLAGAGTIAGLLLAAFALGWLQKLLPASMRLSPATLDGRALVFAMAAATLSAVLFGVIPAIAASRGAVNDWLKQGGRGSAGTRRAWFRDGLVVSETALALVLLTGAGLMIQTLYRLQSLDLGMRVGQVMTMTTYVNERRYPEHAKRDAFYNSALDGVGQIPGVEAAGFTSTLPLTERGNTSGYIFRGQSQQNARNQDALFRVVTLGFLEAIGAQLREGRLFESSDRADSEPVAIINETFAQRHFAGRTAIGNVFQMGRWGAEYPWYKVVGVVKEIRERGVGVDLKPAVYLVHAQSRHAWPVPSALAIRVTGDPAAVVPAVRQVIASIDKDVAVARVQPLSNVVETQLSTPRQSSMLLGAFALLALVLACLGIYGVLAFAVTERTSEIGVRMALGATPGSVLKMVAARGLGLVSIGAAIGLFVSLAMSRFIASLLYGVEATDPATLAAGCAVLLLVGLAASLIPANRAARVDPVQALRAE